MVVVAAGAPVDVVVVVVALGGGVMTPPLSLPVQAVTPRPSTVTARAAITARVLRPCMRLVRWRPVTVVPRRRVWAARGGRSADWSTASDP